jgi:hypothetical protein
MAARDLIPTPVRSALFRAQRAAAEAKDDVLARALAARSRGGARTFTVGPQRHAYFVHRYNTTWRNERAVEVPVALAAMRGNTLEVGNVLWHYGVRGHTVVDKYEASPNVQNVDVVDYTPDERYDSIVTISTVEHMGFDEDVSDPGKPRRGVDHMASLLAPGGTLVATIPFGYNPAATALCAPDADGFDEVWYLRRTTRRGDWEQADWDEVKDAVYGEPFVAANAVAIGVRRAAG